MEYLLLKPIEYEESLPIWSVIKISDGLCKLDNWWSIPVQWLCDHWYLKEIPEEPTQVPEWFKAFSTECYDMEDVGEMTNEGFAEEYEAFLKHYPEAEELPVDEIIQKLEDAHVEYQKSGEDGYNYLYKRFGDILRQYTIKQDTLQQLDVDKVIEYLRSCCAIVTWAGIWVDPTPILSIDSVRLKNILSKYWIPKITKREIEDEASKRRTNREEYAEAVTDFLESKWLLDKSK